MEYIYPDYYKKFNCIADKCEATCCAQWIIVPDDKSLRKYKNFKGDFSARLQNSIDYENKEIRRYKKACVFLNEDNLCDLYIEAGKDMLCKTCRRYPRHYEEFENIREVTLSVSCPEVARILLNKKDKVFFKSHIQTSKEEEYEDFDYILFTKLQETRELFYKILQNRNLSFSMRLSYILAMSHDLNNHGLYEWDELIDKFSNEEFINKIAKKFINYKLTYINKYKNQSLDKYVDYNNNCINHSKNRKIAIINFKSEKVCCLDEIIKTLYINYIEDLSEMEHLKQSWQDTLDKALITINSIDNIYDEYKQFSEYMKDREYEYEQLIIYFLSTYYLGAVYSNRAYDMVRFSAANLLMIKILGFTKWFQNGRSFTKNEQIKLVYNYSREVEHSDNNLNKFEENIHSKVWYNLYNMLLISTQDI